MSRYVIRAAASNSNPAKVRFKIHVGSLLFAGKGPALCLNYADKLHVCLRENLLAWQLLWHVIIPRQAP